MAGLTMDRYSIALGKEPSKEPSKEPPKITWADQICPIPANINIWIAENDGNWDDPNNWSAGRVPTINDKVIFNETVWDYGQFPHRPTAI